MVRKRFILFFSSVLVVSFLHGQQVPYSPVSYRIFSPYVLNPAMTGCKDFTVIHFISTIDGSPESQILSGHTRLMKTNSALNSTINRPQFRNIGVGGYLFNEKTISYRNIGINAMVSYHIPLNRNRISHLAVGLAGKENFTINESGSAEPDSSMNKTFSTPNVDLGLYYYGAQLTAGISAINIFNNQRTKDSLTVWNPSMSRQYSFMTSYKLLINRQDAFVIETFILLNINDQGAGDFSKNIYPGVKVYLRNAYIGTYLNSLKNASFFVQYHFPKFLAGFYLELPYDGSVAWRNKKLILEFMIGVHLSNYKIESPVHRYW